MPKPKPVAHDDAPHFGVLEQAILGAEGFEAFHETAQSDALLAGILDQAQDAEVVSFDVFDTVLWRDGKSELERFHDVATRFAAQLTGAPTLTARACLTARLTCASHAYQLSEMVEHTTEGRLTDIALNMMHALRLEGDRAAWAEKWCETEIEIETEQLRIAPFIDDLIDRLVDMDKQVIFVSDMYLQADQIQTLLENCGCDMSRVAQLISTADTRINKRSGTIFPYLSKMMDIEPEEFLHMGDSLTSDFRKPIEAGWAARYLPVPRKLLQERRDSHFKTIETVFGQRKLPLPMSVPTV